MNETLNKYIDKLKDEIISKTCDIINIPSVFNDNDSSNTPFGKYTVEALNYILDLGKSFGFRTKNIDNKCGYIEFGEGDKLLGIIGHLDVVPAENDWSYSPFNATIDKGNIYGRGAIDNKGPVIAALYAMKAVSDNYKLNKRVRLILGLNEENDWKCIERYRETEDLPNVSFSPDANFPCIYAEKTIESIYLKQKYTPSPTLYIESISTNNNAINVVPKYCSVTLKFDKFKVINIIEELKNLITKYNYNINIKEIDNSTIKLISLGTSAHAAHPELGTNALSKLLIILHELFNLYNINLDILEYFTKYIGDDYTGKNLGINFEDESGILTLNTAQFTLEDNTLSLGFNLRVPVTVDYNIIEKEFKKYCNNDLDISISRIQEPLYLEKNNTLVKQLCDIFNDYNNSNLEPMAIGGGTYARAFENCISFGPQMPNDKDMCHQTDEFISIDNLVFCTKVYAEAILKL